jgi:hypothetical protein
MWKDDLKKIRSTKIIGRVKEERNILSTMKRRKAN